MKKLQSLLLLLLLTACSGDDSISFNNSDIVNKWYITATTFSQDETDYNKGYIPFETNYCLFTSDSKFRDITVTGCSESISTETEYSIKGNKLIRGTSQNEIIELSKNQIKIKEQYRYFVTPAHPVIETVIITYKPVPLQ